MRDRMTYGTGFRHYTAPDEPGVSPLRDRTAIRHGVSMTTNANELRPDDVGIIERAYYTVPGHYGYGPEFPGTLDGLGDAVAHAKSTIKPIPGGWSRAWVEKRFTIRWLPGSGEIGSGVDRPVDRNEIFLTDAEKEAVA